jgi:sirohydrochlorin cobaltochelatase
MAGAKPMKPGLILFAHGARDPAWAAPFDAIAQAVRQDAPQHAVSVAYLELMTPDLATAAAALVGQGCDRITVVPMFLGAGGHVKRDLPALVEPIRQRHTGVTFLVTPAIGESSLVTRAIAHATVALAQETSHRAQP